MRQSNLAETEDLVGRRNCREFGKKFYFLFLVLRIWWSSQPGYKWERTIEDRARDKELSRASLGAENTGGTCARHSANRPWRLRERVIFFSEVLDQVIFIILLLDLVIFFPEFTS
jgi:hypothetical protein